MAKLTRSFFVQCCLLQDKGMKNSLHASTLDCNVAIKMTFKSVSCLCQQKKSANC